MAVSLHFADDMRHAAEQETGKWFLVTRVGCGLAGFTDEQDARGTIATRPFS